MDINRPRKRTERRMKADPPRHRISKEIKYYHNGRVVYRYDTRETFKPVIDTQKEAKETIDRKQDKLIEKVQENQENITNSLHVLSDIMSQQGSHQGSVYGANR